MAGMVKLSREEAWLIDKAIRILRDRHYRHESEVKPETYVKSREAMAKLDELRQRIITEACQ